MRVDNYVDAYRLRAQADDVHEMAARPNKKTLTEFVNRQIFDALQLEPNDVLVDIGCGDASLLRLACGRTSKCIGTVASAEEQSRLKSAFPYLSVVAADIHTLPFESGSVSKIVCNAVLMYLQNENNVKAGLREIARIATPGAVIWVGEIPEIDEYAHYGFYGGASVAGLLLHVLKHNGVRAFFGMLRRCTEAAVGRAQIVLNSADIFYAPPDAMLALAGSCGLRLESYVRHKELDSQGRVVDSRLRYDYVFTV